MAATTRTAPTAIPAFAPTLRPEDLEEAVALGVGVLVGTEYIIEEVPVAKSKGSDVELEAEFGVLDACGSVKVIGEIEVV